MARNTSFFFFHYFLYKKTEGLPCVYLIQMTCALLTRLCVYQIQLTCAAMCVPDTDDLCSAHKTCSDCQNTAGCGWCDDNSGTGTGYCHLGNLTGTIDDVPDLFGLEQSTSPVSGATTPNCPSKSWFYAGTCPGMILTKTSGVLPIVFFFFFF